MSYKTDFIEFMALSGVLLFGDFTTKSGRKTPYFINTGNYKTGSQIAKLGDFYAECIAESGEKPDVLFGPAYKGIPLAVAAAGSLYRLFGRDLPYCFNRKEEKDHGEGGSLIGCRPQSGESVAVIEDVVTAGTAMRETAALFSAMPGVKLASLFVSVDRMEKGPGGRSALDELRDEMGIKIYSIVTVKDIISALHNKEVEGRVFIDDAMLRSMEDYLAKYGS